MIHGPGFDVDLDRRIVRTSDGHARHVTPKAFELLRVLIDASPRVLTKAELHARLWPETFVTDAALSALVKELRRVLPRTDGTSPIRTAHGVGYAVDVPPSVSTGVAHVLVAAARRFVLDDGEHVIGRDQTARVCVDGTEVSRRHALLRVHGAVATIEDLRSKNGTAVNGVDARMPVTLADGDRISIGAETLTYLWRDAADSTATRNAVI